MYSEAGLQRVGPFDFQGWVTCLKRTWTIVRPAGDRHTPEALAALEAIRALPPAYRETLLLRLVEGMTGPEIARRTGLTEGSVRVNLCRGMELLRNLVGAGEQS